MGSDTHALVQRFVDLQRALRKGKLIKPAHLNELMLDADLLLRSIRGRKIRQAPANSPAAASQHFDPAGQAASRAQ